MSNNGNNSLSYNNGSDIPYVVSEIFEYLVKYGSEDFWKAIKYPDYDCLSKPNLTLKEKRDLIYTYGEDINKFSIYLNSPLIAPEQSESKVIIKAYKIRTKPINRMDFILSYNFDILTHTTIANIESKDTMVSRTDFIESELISMLNGRDFSFGMTIYDRELSLDAQTYLGINNSNNFFGSTFCIVVDNLRADGSDICG